MTNVQNEHGVPFNREKNPVYIWSSTVKELAYFKREFCVFGGERTPMWNIGERSNRILQRQIPTDTSAASMVPRQPLQD